MGCYCLLILTNEQWQLSISLKNFVPIFWTNYTNKTLILDGLGAGEAERDGHQRTVGSTEISATLLANSGS